MDPSDRPTIEENQREAERAALRNVRATLDKLERQTQGDPGSWIPALVVGSVAAIVLVGASFFALTGMKREHRENDAFRTGMSTADLQYSWQVEMAIKAKLTIPGGLPETTSAVALLTLSQTGEVVDFTVSKSSGYPSYDKAIRHAASRAGPFGPIPASADPSKPYQLRLQIGVRDSR